MNITNASNFDSNCYALRGQIITSKFENWKWFQLNRRQTVGDCRPTECLEYEANEDSKPKETTKECNFVGIFSSNRMVQGDEMRQQLSVAPVLAKNLPMRGLEPRYPA